MMPLPAEIQSMLDTAGADFNPAAARDEYTKYLPVWRSYLDLYEMDEVKLAGMLDKHADDEDSKKYALRQRLSAIYNLVPTIINLSRNYIFSEAPTISAKDARLQAFIDDCDGNGLSLGEWVKSQALPLAQVCGFVDAVVSHPNTSGEEFKTAADVQQANLKPHIVGYTPIDRVNWSCSPDGGYNWARYLDVGDEGLNPFKPPIESAAYVTLTAVEDQPNAAWLRSVNQPKTGDNGATTANYVHDGDICPTKRVPIATLFHQRSIDRQRRRDAISKISTIAILTKQIIQILSWTTEDVLANLAILGIPTKNGTPPKKEDGTQAITSLGSFSIIYYPIDAKNPPGMIQGEVNHIQIKMTLVENHLREIMRVANLMVAAGDASSATSGVQAVVERNELFRELKDTASSLDAFGLEILALAASWIQNKDITAIMIKDQVTVSFFKGPFTVEPLKDVIANAQAVIDLMRDLSPAAVEAVLKQVARASIVGDDQALKNVLGELEGSGDNPPVKAAVVALAPTGGTAQAVGETIDSEA